MPLGAQRYCLFIHGLCHIQPKQFFPASLWHLWLSGGRRVESHLYSMEVKFIEALDANAKLLCCTLIDMGAMYARDGVVRHYIKSCAVL